MPDEMNGRLATIETKLDGILHWLEYDMPLHTAKTVMEFIEKHEKRMHRSGPVINGIPIKWLGILIPALAALLYAVAKAYEAVAK